MPASRGEVYIKSSSRRMKPPRAYARGILHFFGPIRRSTLLAYSAEAAASAAKAGRSPSFGGSPLRIHPWAYAHGLLRRRIKINPTACNRTGRLRINLDPTKFSGHMPYQVVICNGFRHNNDQTSSKYANPRLVNAGQEPSLRWKSRLWVLAKVPADNLQDDFSKRHRGFSRYSRGCRCGRGIPDSGGLATSQADPIQITRRSRNQHRPPIRKVHR